jgi:ribosome biogenesis GTPase / thiamine phosphate phosphatase
MELHELSSLGFGPSFEEQLIGGDEVPARIAAEHRQGYTVWCTTGGGFARLSGRLTRDLDEDAHPGVGDWVVLRAVPVPGNTAIIDRVLARRTIFTRGAAGGEARRQVIAANVDIVFIVCGLDADYNVHRIQRYVARVRASGARPVVVLNKTDACADTPDRVAEVQRATPGVQVLTTSARLRRGLDHLQAQLGPGITAALVGSSGAGKSTLINALLGEERLRTGELRASDGRGRHTTSERQMLESAACGLLIDTPGMRELALFDDEGIGELFSEIEELALRCRFRDCSHQSEPGCAVLRAVEDGYLPADPLAHYLEMTAEARAFELRHDERLRRRSERTVGRQRATDLKLINRRKEGR